MKKFFTLIAAAMMAVATFAETETLGKANATDKDTDIALTSFTVKGTYNPSGTSKTAVAGEDTGIKLRTNKPTVVEGTEGLEFSVNSGYQITGITMNFVLNDDGASKLTGVYVDGVDQKVASMDMDKNTILKVELSNITAKSSISFTFDNTAVVKNKQIFAVADVQYEASTAVEAVKEAKVAPVKVMTANGVVIGNVNAAGQIVK